MAKQKTSRSKKSASAKPKQAKYKGVFIQTFKTQKQTFKVGEKYSTPNKKVYEYLINLKIIE